MDYKEKPLPFSKQLKGISQKTIETHHDKLYAGYVKKMIEVSDRLREINKDVIAGDKPGNQTFSELRSLKEAETFAVNGTYLHEYYFDVLGGEGTWDNAPELSAAIAGKWGSIEDFIKYFSQCGMASRGWTLLAWDTHVGKLKQYNGDTHNQGGVWGSIPIIVLDIYEHAYFMDFGADRMAYIKAFWENFNWEVAEKLYKKASQLTM